MDKWIDYAYFYLPLCSILIFSLWWFPMVEKNWLLIRVWLSGIIGCHFVLERVFKEYSIQGSGIGMAYIAGMLFEFIFLFIGSVFIKLRF